jgi:cytoskeletal protein CcmA (bactofilin family)
MSMLGKTLSLTGEVSAPDEITIEGRVDGPIWCENGAVTLAASAVVTGDIVARDVTVFGRFAGQLLATEVADLRPDASVEGTVVAARLIVNEGARFNGRSEPQHLEAALKVARFRRQKRSGAPIDEPPRQAPPPPKPKIVTRRPGQR